MSYSRLEDQSTQRLRPSFPSGPGLAATNQASDRYTVPAAPGRHRAPEQQQIVTPLPPEPGESTAVISDAMRQAVVGVPLPARAPGAAMSAALQVSRVEQLQQRARQVLAAGLRALRGKP